MQVLLSWSGGKDAAWTLHALRQRGDVEVVGLLTTITREHERASMQGLRRSVLQAQAQAAGLPLLEAGIPANCGSADYEAAMTAALVAAAERWPDLRTVAFGDLFLEDIRAYRVERLAHIGWEALTPLFGSDTGVLARAMLDGGLRAALCCVDTTQLDPRFAGRDFDAALLAELPEAVDPCGEHGEFHTCAWDGPMFQWPVAVEHGADVLRDDRFLYTDFRVAERR